VAQKDYEESLPFYANANVAFRKFVELKDVDLAKKEDAYLRIGDCFYVNKSYKQAIEAYQMGSKNQKDYLTYQSALCFGFEGNNSKKIELLKSLTDQGVLTKFKVDAAVELASTYVTEENYSSARDIYKQVLADQPQSSYTRGILVDLCLIYRELNNEEKVKETWNKLFKEYSTDKVIVDALSIVKPVLIDDEEFQAQIKTLKIANVTEAEIENDVFEKAAAAAYGGDCEKGQTRLLNYLHQYPQAINASEANYIIATCLYDAGKPDEAISYYEKVIELPFSNYTEESLNKAAAIRIQQGEFANAIGHLLKIEAAAISKNSIADAQVALMSSYYAIKEFGMAREYADKVISDVSAIQENKDLAMLYRARIKMSEEEFDSALADFKEVAKAGGEGAAESAYNHAWVEFKRADYDKAEKSIFKTIEKFSSYEKWKLESFLLLADVYMKKPDWVQCRKTLDNIISKVKDPIVVERARAKKVELDNLENPVKETQEVIDPLEEQLNEEFNENE
jgi:tetratricopeptide (TPR) repeat protein